MGRRGRQIAHLSAGALWFQLVAASSLSLAQEAVLVGPVEERVLERVRGQTADLPYTIEVVDVAGVDFERAIALGAERGAEIVLRVEADGGALVVEIVEVRERRLFARRIEPDPGEPLGGSAVAEAAALVIRGALADLARGGHIGIAVPSSPEPEPAPAAEPEPALAAPPARPHLRASVSAAIAIDGAAPRAHLGPAIHLGVELDWIELAIDGRVGVPETIATPTLSLAITRYAIRAGAAIELLDLPDWRATLGIALGVVAHDRSTSVLDPSLDPTTPATTASFLASLDARLAWMPIEHGVIGLELALGADVLPIAPRFTVDRDGAPQVLAAPWPVQPTVALGLAIRAP